MSARVLLTDNIAPEAVAVFDRASDIVAERTDTLPPEQLTETIGGFDAVIVRSPTQITADIIANADRLRFIGRAGVGVDNIDVAAASERGIVVMNAPGGNTVSTAEHTIAVMLSLARQIPHAHASVTGGAWDRKTYRGTEMSGKTLGIVGLGRVGREVATRMRAFDMTVIASDPIVTPEVAAMVDATLVPLSELLERSDWITVHVPLLAETRGMIGAGEIAAMKRGVVLVNCARGGVIDESALADALDSGQVAAVGLDVYETEPPGENRLFAHSRSVFTPHLGAATGEAQVRVAVEVAEAVAEALTTGVTRNAINPQAAR